MERTTSPVLTNEDPYGLLARWLDAHDQGDRDALDAVALVTRAVVAVERKWPNPA